MKKPKASLFASWVLSEYEEQDNLNAVVKMLNDHSGPEDNWNGKMYDSEDAARLRRLVIAWMQYECNFHDFFLGGIEPGDRDAMERLFKGIGAQVNRATGTLRIIDNYPATRGVKNPRYDEAAIQFNRLLNNSQHALLGGPCRYEKCQKWFVKKTRRSSFYCSRKCGGNDRKGDDRTNERVKKLEDVQQAIQNYEAARGRGRFANLGWKEYVRQATGVSKKWLTCALIKCDIVPPEEGVHHAAR